MPPSDYALTQVFFPWHVVAPHASSFMKNNTSGNSDVNQKTNNKRHYPWNAISTPPRASASVSSSPTRRMSSSFGGGYFPCTKPEGTKSLLPDTPRGGRVKFDSYHTQYAVMPISDYSPAEVKATWYDRYEIRAMRQQCRDDAVMPTSDDNYDFHGREAVRSRDDSPLADRTMNVLVGGMGPLSSTSTSSHLLLELPPRVESPTQRGLENKTSMGALRKKRHRMQAWTAVLCEQRRQRMEGIVDVDALADAYFEVSEPCHVAANMMGIRDARDIESKQQQQQQPDCVANGVMMTMMNDKENLVTHTTTTTTNPAMVDMLVDRL